MRTRSRIIEHFEPGSSTAVPTNVSYRLGKIRKLGLLEGEWLDCGCADGGYTVALAELGAKRAVGVDAQEERIVHACERTRNRASIAFLCASADDLPFPDASFDGAFLNEVLEHVTDEVQVLREIHRVLRPGGHLVVMSPNRWFPFEGHGMHIGRYKVPFPIPLLPWIPTAIAQKFMEARNYWPYELIQLIRGQGFDICTRGFVWPVFEVYPWLPRSIISRYRDLVPALEGIPFIRCFGVSIYAVARRL
jgi:SAM-dependent methyltransferase